MSLLMVNDWVSYSELRSALSTPEQEISDGNLASHLRKLRENKFIKDKKEFLNRKPHTSYQATEQGRKAFEEHLDALEEIIKNMN